MSIRDCTRRTVLVGLIGLSVMGGVAQARPPEPPSLHAAHHLTEKWVRSFNKPGEWYRRSLRCRAHVHRDICRYVMRDVDLGDDGGAQILFPHWTDKLIIGWCGDKPWIDSSDWFATPHCRR
jgi:hypothetical protein